LRVVVIVVAGCWLLLLEVEVDDWAWAKSRARRGSFGETRVEVVDGEAKPWNCEVRSEYCFWREERVEARVSAAWLLGSC
jgi:hypothetical protein